MHGTQGFNLLLLFPFLRDLPAPVSTSVLVAALLIIFMSIARLQLNRVMKSSSDGGLVPDGSLTYRNFFEILAEGLFKLTQSVLGEDEAPHFFPMIGSLFVFILFSNLMGLLPFIPPSTGDMNMTLALGVFVFLYYHYVGFKVHGLRYLKHFLGPVIWLAPLMLVIELASHFFRPLSLALRLRGNMMGDHIILGIFSDLVPLFLPVIFYGLGLFVSVMQAFVFCLMTMVYISLSTSHDH